MAQISVPKAAERLGVSERRIQQRIEDGSLPAERIGGRWVIESADLHRLAERSPGRPLSNRMAWSLIRRAAGESPSSIGLAPAERSRINKRLAEIAASDNPAPLLRRLLSNRADRLLYRASPRDLPALRADPHLSMSGLSHPDSGMAAADLVEAYVARDHLADLVDRYLLDEAPEHDRDPARRANVILHVVDQRVDFAWENARFLVALDLADHFGDREDEAARQIVADLLGSGAVGRSDDDAGEGASQ